MLREQHSVLPHIQVTTCHIPDQMLGQFELLVKVYDEGVMSQHLNSLSVGDKAEFKHFPKNLKVSAYSHTHTPGRGRDVRCRST